MNKTLGTSLSNVFAELCDERRGEVEEGEGGEREGD